MTTDLDALRRRVLREEENQYFDRKSLFEGPPGHKKPRHRKDVRDQIAEYVAAFANADGGLLVLGAEDDGPLTGHAYPPDVVDQMLVVSQQRLKPAQPAGRRVTLDGQDLLVFEVTPAPRAVMVIGNGFPLRVGDEVVKGSEEAINSSKDRGLVASPEARLADRAAFADLDRTHIERAMVAAAFSGTPEEYLEARRLADRRGEEIVLRNGAVWLFARNAGVIQHPNIGVRVFRVNGTEQRSGRDRNVQDFPWIDGNLVSVLERARTLVASLVRTSTKLHDLFFRETPEYPEFAWQEALVNALAHRDYAIEGRCVEVHLYDDRMEVHSPGGLLPSVPLEALAERRRVHESRNPRMARVLTELGIMRQQGEGIPRMIEEMELSWLPSPEFVPDGREFLVVLRNEPIFQGVDADWTAAVRGLPLDVRQRRALVAFSDRREFQSGDYQALNRVDRDTAYRELNVLEEMGLLDAQGATRGRTYRVKREAGPPLPTGRSPMARLEERMSRYGRITNTDYREAFGVERRAATEALAAMVADGMIEARGERRAAHYVAGPRWPPAK